MNERIIEEMDIKMKDLQVIVKDTEIRFECDIQHLEEIISVLGHLVEERDIQQIPNYSVLKQPRISVGYTELYEEGLDDVRGIAFDERTQFIYIAHGDILTAPRNISVFSVTGDLIKAYHDDLLTTPEGIAISGEELYVSDSWLNSIFHFQLPDFQFVSRVGKTGKGKEEFMNPHNMTVGPDGWVYVADWGNNRIVVMDGKLKHNNMITHHSMIRLCDVKLLENEIYVLSDNTKPRILVFSQNGQKIRTLKTLVKTTRGFCFDKRNNYLIGDFSRGKIKVFSKDGALLHILGDNQDRDKRIKPMGIVVTNNNEITCGSCHTKFGLHIF
ncbi:Tripartite motif-containing protein 2-like [Oopsacas minuta]|uniref:Tripartite motif-containing protein 2-like n=1 Tax=Oopsacas minuta TaxID=111878 RepID=A0AAV7JP71_9METZ|nr:Tripartite motif-containing protein 2-like [Oopsacas minuta]